MNILNHESGPKGNNEISETNKHTYNKKIKSRNPKTLKYKNDKPKKPITYHSVPLTRFLPSFFCPQRLLTER